MSHKNRKLPELARLSKNHPVNFQRQNLIRNGRITVTSLHYSEIRQYLHHHPEDDLAKAQLDRKLSCETSIVALLAEYETTDHSVIKSSLQKRIIELIQSCSWNNLKYAGQFIESKHGQIFNALNLRLSKEIEQARQNSHTKTLQEIKKAFPRLSVPEANIKNRLLNFPC